MVLVTLLLRSLLIAIFAIAGISKLSDQNGTRVAVTNFGASKKVAPIIAIMLPFFELLIASGLIFGQTVWLSSLAALFLLSLFSLVIGVNLAQGRTHDCHCFGQLHSRPLGWQTLLKNLVFALAAIIVLWQLSRGYPAAFVELAAGLNKPQTELFIFVLLLMGCVLVYAQTQKVGSGPADQNAGLALNSPAPAFQLIAYDGGSKTLDHFLNEGRPLMLLFTNPNCGPCVNLFQEIKDWQLLHGDQLTITLISRGTIKENFVSVAKNGLGQVLLQENTEVAELYGARVTPAAVLVNPEGRIASRMAAGADEIRSLLHSTVVTQSG
jgi:peroxiredoxin/uncharacterized membrane protein YphA (DoxX/SURF4 family)